MDTKYVNALRMLGVDMINKANSGHPGIVLGAAPILFALIKDHLYLNPQDPNWFDRDRFVLSAGHGSALLYSSLHLMGFKISIDDLKQFRQLNSITPGHPERGLTPGVEVSTGPLGQGIAMGIGMGIAEAHLGAIFNKSALKIIDHYTYILCGDGDLQEGVGLESISLAGKLKLNKVILLHDSNDVQLDSLVKKAQATDLQKLFQACGWNSILVDDGQNIQAISAAISQAKQSDQPTYIEVKTMIGYGATKQGTSAVHGEPLKEDIANVRKNLEWKHQPFEIDQEIYAYYQSLMQKGLKKYSQWNTNFNTYSQEFPELAKILQNNIAGKIQVDLKQLLTKIPTVDQTSRVSSGEILNNLNTLHPNLIGGSADLSSSTKIKGANGNFTVTNQAGKNILYGVREFAMAAINNGIAAHEGLIPFGSTFFVFSDYLKPAIRLAALMKLRNLFIFTHDSIAVGEDGPTHEPIEQLAMLRSIPNVNLFRPCDYQETAVAYKLALENNTIPTVIVLTRQNLKEQVHNNVFEEVSKGAYIIDQDDDPIITIIATGSEVELAIQVKKILNQQNLRVNVVSMPSMHLFNNQSNEYKQSVIKPSTFKVSIEMGSTFGWERYTSNDGVNIGIDTFGVSAPGDQAIEYFGFNPTLISQKILNTYENRK